MERSVKLIDGSSGGKRWKEWSVSVDVLYKVVEALEKSEGTAEAYLNKGLGFSPTDNVVKVSMRGTFSQNLESNREHSKEWAVSKRVFDLVKTALELGKSIGAAAVLGQENWLDTNKPLLSFLKDDDFEAKPHTIRVAFVLEAADYMGDCEGCQGDYRISWVQITEPGVIEKVELYIPNAEREMHRPAYLPKSMNEPVMCYFRIKDGRWERILENHG